MNASKFLSEAEKRSIEESVAMVEKRTSAEIVCAIATESGRYDRAEGVVGILGSFLGLVALNWFHQRGAMAEGSWEVLGELSLAWQLIAVGVGFLVGNFVASSVHPIRRLFTSRNEISDETLHGAWIVFASRGLTRTASRGGLLLYLSLYEKRVVALGDSSIVATLGQGFLDEIRNIGVAELHSGRRAGAFLKMLEAASSRLQSALPAQPDDKNELPDAFAEIHPRP